MTEPQFQFRGIALPADIVLQFVERKLTRAELCILILVEALTSCRGEGCWAGNEYFAEKLGLAANYVCNSIHKLIKSGFLLISHKNGKRYLETCWSRTLLETSTKKIDTENSLSGYRKFCTDDTENSVQIHKDRMKEKDLEDICPDDRRDNINKNGFFAPPEKSSGEEIEIPLDLEIAQFLRSVVAEAKHIRINEKLTRWVDKVGILRRQLDSDSDRIKKVFGHWYRRHAGKDNVPIITCCKGINQKVFCWLENLVDQALEDERVIS